MLEILQFGQPQGPSTGRHTHAGVGGESVSCCLFCRPPSTPTLTPTLCPSTPFSMIPFSSSSMDDSLSSNATLDSSRRKVKDVELLYEALQREMWGRSAGVPPPAQCWSEPRACGPGDSTGGACGCYVGSKRGDKAWARHPSDLQQPASSAIEDEVETGCGGGRRLEPAASGGYAGRTTGLVPGASEEQNGGWPWCSEEECGVHLPRGVFCIPGVLGELPSSCGQTSSHYHRWATADNRWLLPTGLVLQHLQQVGYLISQWTWVLQWNNNQKAEVLSNISLLSTRDVLGTIGTTTPINYSPLEAILPQDTVDRLEQDCISIVRVRHLGCASLFLRKSEQLKGFNFLAGIFRTRWQQSLFRFWMKRSGDGPRLCT